MTDNVAGSQRGAVPFLLFRVGQHLCGLPLAYVVETMRPLPIEVMAGAPAAVAGAAVIRGTPLPVLDLGALLGGEAEPATRFVTVRAGARLVALAVTAVVGLQRLPVDAIQDVPPLLREASGEAVQAVAALDAELLLILNAARLMPENVWPALDSAGAGS